MSVIAYLGSGLALLGCLLLEPATLPTPPLIAALPGPATSAPAPATAPALVARAIEQLGGAERWQRVRSVQVQGVGHRLLLEQSERPEGPFIPEYLHFTSLHDLAARRQRTRTRVEGFGYEFSSVVIASDSVVAQQQAGRFFHLSGRCGKRTTT